MTNYHRLVFDLIERNLFKGKVIVLFGARRTGKTTLVKSLIAKYGGKYVNCELQENTELLQQANSILLADFIGNQKLIVFDEAQHISNIGLILKVLVDTFPQVQFVATGSSSFELANQVSEPLTGRTRQYLMFPLSLQELHQVHELVYLQANLESYLCYGLYPQVLTESAENKLEELIDIANNYLYKDVLQFETLKKPDLLQKLLQALALQCGSEVSLNELAQTTGTSVHTITRYLDLLEKSFVIFRLRALSRNLRKELNKSQKVFFFDTGIRNAILRNFTSLSLRTDAGGLWENFCIAERLKYNANNRRFVNTYFWRTYDQQEIDYIEEKDGQFNCFEFKLNPKAKQKIPAAFKQAYPDATFTTISPGNFYELFKETAG